MRCVNCRWYHNENEVCLKDGCSVFNPSADAPCEYADNMTVFDRITQSPEGLAEALVRCEHWTITSESPEKGIEHEYWTSIFIDMLYPTKAEAIAATVARLKEMAE